MKVYYYVLLAAQVFCFSTSGQTQSVKGKISSLDTAELKILSVFPEEFPEVSVLFRAETKKGEPVWNLTKEKMKVMEDANECDVISLEQISKTNPINLGVVIDHSGSMMVDYAQLYTADGTPLYTYDENYNPVPPPGYISPIDNAKKAVKQFIKSFDFKKDYISITGFSRTVDIIQTSTQDTVKLNAAIDKMNADYSTALYDAMGRSLIDLKYAKGIKVMVVLTDGNDNSSKNRWDQVIEAANLEKIPIYIIGLGNVNKDTLNLIANATNGKFYYVHSSNSLDDIYAQISKRVQAFYSLTYTSVNLSSADASRDIELSFETDSLFLEKDIETLVLPEKVVEYIRKKEKQKEYILYGTIVLAVFGGGALLYYVRKKKSSDSVFPNPSTGVVTIKCPGGIGELKILNTHGEIVRTLEITGTEMNVDLSDLVSGNYKAHIHSTGSISTAMNFVIQK